MENKDIQIYQAKNQELKIPNKNKEIQKKVYKYIYKTENKEYQTEKKLPEFVYLSVLLFVIFRLNKLV